MRSHGLSDDLEFSSNEDKVFVNSVFIILRSNLE